MLISLLKLDKEEWFLEVAWLVSPTQSPGAWPGLGSSLPTWPVWGEM